MSNKTDITMYSDDELSMMFQNDEGLYNNVRFASDFSDVKDVADDLFEYTYEQMQVLETDYMDGTLT